MTASRTDGAPEVFISESDMATRAFASNFAKTLSDDAYVGLSGDLGAGKTTFVKGIAEGLGISAHVKSPTYNIMSIYEAPTGKKLVHIDAYRLRSADDFDNLVVDEVAPPPRCVCVEWCENAAKSIPPDAAMVEMSIDASGRRVISILRHPLA